MVAATKQMIRSSGTESHDECYATPLPQKFMDELQNLGLTYPGWEKEYNMAREQFQFGSEVNFSRAFRKMRGKQRVYDDYKAFARLNSLASLELAYPGSEIDKQTVEEWHLKHLSNDETDMVFQDKLEGLRNKGQLFFGDRSHPNIQDLDSLELTYPSWEKDYQAAVTAHCDTPAKSFANILHRLRQKQSAFGGDRSHWRLVELDNLRLTYPGWETDMAEVEDWHFCNADTTKNDSLYAEVIEGMKDQQQIYLGWDHDDDTASSDDESSSSTQKSSGTSIERERKERKKMIQSYTSITESLNSVEGKRKKLLQGLSTCSSNSVSRSSNSSKRWNERSPSPTERTSLLSSRREAPIPVTVREPQEESSGPPPKQLSLGKCEVCFTRSKTHIFVPCGHICACAACSHKAMDEAGACPICRQEAENSFRVFLT